jgi:GTPase Era involved in 16S rRNA processing
LSGLIAKEAGKEFGFDSIAVVGTIGSGKSTLLNAMGCMNLLPYRSASGTMNVIRIKNEHHEYPMLRQKKIQNRRWGKWLPATAELLREWNQESGFQIELKGYFPRLSDFSSIAGLSFFDTPGSNRSEGLLFEEVLDYVQESSQASLYLCVLNAKYFGTKDERDLLNRLLDRILQHPLSSSAVFAVNKMDAFDIEKGEIPKQRILEVKDYLEEIGFKAPAIFPVMAELSLSIRLMFAGLRSGYDAMSPRKVEKMRNDVRLMKHFEEEYRSALIHDNQHEPFFLDALAVAELTAQTFSQFGAGCLFKDYSPCVAEVYTGVSFLERYLSRCLPDTPVLQRDALG